MTIANVVMIGLAALFGSALLLSLATGRVEFVLFRTAIARRSNPLFYWLLVGSAAAFLYVCVLYVWHTFLGGGA